MDYVPLMREERTLIQMTCKSFVCFYVNVSMVNVRTVYLKVGSNMLDVRAFLFM